MPAIQASETVVVRSTVTAEKPRGVSGNVTPNSVKNLRHLAGKMTGKTKKLGPRAISRTDVWDMARRRAADAGIETAIGCHTFRATGITAV